MLLCEEEEEAERWEGWCKDDVKRCERSEIWGG